jgi:hypothetical protein
MAKGNRVLPGKGGWRGNVVLLRSSAGRTFPNVSKFGNLASDAEWLAR